MTTGPDETRRGSAYVLAAYGIWGLFPLYFDALRPAGALEILAHRIVWSLAFCGAVLVVQRDLRWLWPVLRTPRLMLGMLAAAALIASNWGFYVYAVITGQTTEASLGYFLNPIVTVALGVVVLREHLRRPQLVAVVIGALAGVYLTVSAGRVPLLALVLAFSFGLYGLVKVRVGASLTAMRGLALETAILTPFALALIGWTAAHGTATFGSLGTGHTLLLASAGVVTAIPLLLSRRSCARCSAAFRSRSVSSSMRCAASASYVRLSPVSGSNTSIRAGSNHSFARSSSLISAQVTTRMPASASAGPMSSLKPRAWRSCSSCASP